MNDDIEAMVAKYDAETIKMAESTPRTRVEHVAFACSLIRVGSDLLAKEAGNSAAIELLSAIIYDLKEEQT